MNRHIRPISDDAVNAIAAQQMLWQFSQCNYSTAFTGGSSATVKASPMTVTVSSFPYASPTCDFISTTSSHELFGSIMVGMSDILSILERMQFEKLYAEWIATRGVVSSIHGDISRNPAYYKIVGMGPSVLPFIFEHLKDEMSRGMPDHWFAALWAISGGENPVPDADQGRIRKMAEAWLRWGAQRGCVSSISI